MGRLVMVIAIMVITLGLTQPASDISPAVREMLAAADAAIAQVNTLSYEGSYRGTGASAVRAPVVTGRVILLRQSDGDLFDFRIDGEVSRVADDMNGAIASHSAGRINGQMIRLDHEAKLAIRGGSQILQLGPVGNLLPPELVWSGPFSQLLDRRGASAIVEGRAFADGVLCDVVRLEAPRRGVDRWFLGVEDHLPRRLERSRTRNSETGALVLVLKGMTVDAELTPDALALEVPEQYSVRSLPPGSGTGGVGVRRDPSRGGGR